MLHRKSPVFVKVEQAFKCTEMENNITTKYPLRQQATITSELHKLALL